MQKAAFVLAACLATAAMVGCGGQSPEQGKTGAEAMTVSIKMVDTMTVASMAKTGPYSGAGQAIAELLAWAEKSGIEPMIGPFGVFHSGPDVPQEEALYEVCIQVPSDTKSDEAAGVAVRQLDGLQVATTRHVGPYDKTQAAYDNLMMWIDDNGYVVSGPAIEFYLTNPETTPPESLQTDIGFVVKQMPEEEETE